MSGADGEEMEAGRVGRPHGLDGSFHVRRARANLLQLGTRVRVGAATTSIVRRAGTERSPIVRLEGVEDRAGAQALLGLSLLVSRAHAPALGEGEWWAHELEGCTVLDGERRIGTVARMIELPSCEALQVVREQGPELLVPMVRDAIRRVDVKRGEIEIDAEFLGEQR